MKIFAYVNTKYYTIKPLLGLSLIQVERAQINNSHTYSPLHPFTKKIKTQVIQLHA